jgi:predicted ATPase
MIAIKICRLAALGCICFFEGFPGCTMLSDTYIKEFKIQGYRSLLNLNIELDQINIITGANGCGKSNLYKAVHLLAKSAEGRLAKSLALEGGMSSVLFAGQRKSLTQTKKPIRMTMSAITDGYSYELSCGLPTPSLSMFGLDPQVKEEYVWHGHQKRKSTLFLERKVGSAFVVDNSNTRVDYPVSLRQSESVLSQLHEPHLYPELSHLRETMRRWRFYHHFRSDSHSAIRQPQISVRTPILSDDGNDLAAALQTILEIGDEVGLKEVIDDAFPGSTIIIHSENSRFKVLLNQPGIKRPLDAQELSDGTLRYLCLVAALMSPQPPNFLALNEPEMSLHPDLMKPLANLILKAAEYSQLFITTHSNTLVKQITKLSGAKPRILEKNRGETVLADL